jgi:hypothetical protein
MVTTPLATPKTPLAVFHAACACALRALRAASRLAPAPRMVKMAPQFQESQLAPLVVPATCDTPLSR